MGFFDRISSSQRTQPQGTVTRSFAYEAMPAYGMMPARAIAMTRESDSILHAPVSEAIPHLLRQAATVQLGPFANNDSHEKNAPADPDGERDSHGSGGSGGVEASSAAADPDGSAVLGASAVPSDPLAGDSDELEELDELDDYDDYDEPTEGRSFAGKRILLVEDNELNREIASEILKDCGFRIEAAFDGDIAVDMVREATEEKGADYYDYVLMDIQMPRMDGYESTRQIRKLPFEEEVHLPIIAMTANTSDDDRRLAFEVGMDAFLTKPIDIPLLLDTLRQHMR